MIENLPLTYTPNKVCELLYCSRKALYLMVKTGKIEQPIQLGNRRIGYLKYGIDLYHKNKIEEINNRKQFEKDVSNGKYVKKVYKRRVNSGIHILKDTGEIIYRKKNVSEILNCTVSTLDRMVKDGLIQKPVSLGGPFVGFPKSYIESFLMMRILERDKIYGYDFSNEIDLSLDAIYRPKKVWALLDCSKSTLERLVKSGAIKNPIKLSKRSIGFLKSDIDAFLEERILERDELGEIYGPKKVCKLLGCSKATLIRMVNNGLINKPAKMGCAVGYAKPEIDAFLKNK